STVTAASLNLGNPYFCYAFNTRMDPNGPDQFRRSDMTSAASTIVLGEATEDSFPTTQGRVCPSRHFGGANFVLGDGHAEWIKHDSFCRQGNGTCPNNFPEADSSGFGDWGKGVEFHWFPYQGAPT